MSLTWNPRLVKTPTPIMSAMTMAVAVDAVARFELPLLAGIIGYLPPWEPAYRCRPFVAQAGKEFDAAHPTLTTGVHFGLDNDGGFFNPASCAFAALVLSPYSLPSTDGDGFFDPASRAFAALPLSACSLPSIDGDGFFNPASCAFAARLSACSLPSIGGDGFFNPARCAFAALRLSAYSLPSIGATCGGSLSRYGRPIPSCFSCASIHFHKISLHVNLSARVSPFTLTRSAASP